MIGYMLTRAVERGWLKDWHIDKENELWVVTIIDRDGDRFYTLKWDDREINAFVHGMLAASEPEVQS